MVNCKTRIWCKRELSSPLTIWDAGDEQWLCSSDGNIQHFRIHSRSKNENGEICEMIEELPETCVALEAILQTVAGWEIKTEEEKKYKQVPPAPAVNKAESDKESTTTSYSSNTLPTELWLSLAQWIPPERFYQPSLHNQAIAELSDIPAQQHIKSYQFQPKREYRPSQATNHGKRFFQPMTKPMFV